MYVSTLAQDLESMTLVGLLYAYEMLGLIDVSVADLRGWRTCRQGSC
jgi:hypothetical protein